VTILFTWKTEGAAGRIIDKHSPRRPYLHHDISHSTDNQSRHTQGFDAIGEETNGLMEIRSEGCQDREVYPLPAQVRGHATREVVFNPLMVSRTAGERKVSLGNGADDASLC
jgi:hypothetical protein